MKQRIDVKRKIKIKARIETSHINFSTERFPRSRQSVFNVQHTSQYYTHGKKNISIPSPLVSHAFDLLFAQD